MKNAICYCGHDCSRCRTYLAAVHNDERLREQVQTFYRKEFSVDIPFAAVRCGGGRSDKLFFMCEDCPFRKCCRERGIEGCTECPEYPCEVLRKYRDTYVNKCNQINGSAKTD